MSNSFYGKTLENVRNRQDIEIVNDEKRYEWLVANPTFKRSKIFAQNVVACHKYRTSVYQNKFNYIGFTILELSKQLMYWFMYDVLKKNIPDIKAHYRDTDSLMIEIELNYGENIEDTIKKIEFALDSSELGKFKDELGNKYIKEFAVTCAKSYGYTTTNDENTIHIKGINNTDLYEIETIKNVLYNNEIEKIDTYGLHSDKHLMFLDKQNKIALTSFDDKRFICSDGITTLPYGNDKIKIFKRLNEINKKYNTALTDLDIYNVKIR